MFVVRNDYANIENFMDLSEYFCMNKLTFT